jgi:hypothetical protein
MAITVEGYGNITQGNAKEIYIQWKRGNVELNTVQQKKCESYLSQEDYDEISYDTEANKNSGADKINTDGTDKKEGGNAAGTTGGNMASVVATTALANVARAADGFTALILSIAALACAGSSIIFTKMFDSAYSDRVNANSSANDTNQTLDTYNESLASSMDMMTEDVATYNNQQTALTTTVNEQTSQMADLQMQYDTAVSMGDTNKAQQLKEQMQALQETDNSGLEDELAETSGAIEEYRAMAEESGGVSESGQSVSNFLKEGTGMGVVATANSVILALGIAAMYMCAATHVPKIWALGVPIDGAASIGAKITYGACGALFSLSLFNMTKKAKNEFECGSAGGEMQEHVNSLNDMIAQQGLYTDDTEEQFAAADEAAAESQAEATEAAGNATSQNASNIANLGNKDKDKENSTTTVS